MADIAKASGVSITTVSHVINRTRPVRAATEEAVLAAIADVGYLHSGLGTPGTGNKTFGVAMSAISNQAFNELINGIERAASRFGYSLLLSDTHDDVSVELRALSGLLARQVEAILLAPSADPTAALRYAHGQGVPVVLLDRTVDADVDQISSENIVSTGQLVDHLAGLGHQNITLLSGWPGISTTDERIDGFRQAMARNGLEVRPENILSGHGIANRSEELITRVMTSSRPPSALVVGNNRMTIGAMRALRRLDLEVPRDVALVAFDDFEWADLFRPRLTVIAQPTVRMAEQAVELAMSRLDTPGRETRRVVMTPAFVHRESCGCFPTHPA